MSDQPQASTEKKRGRGLSIWFGVFLILFAIAHAYAGIVGTSYRQPAMIWAGTTGWFLATCGLVLAAYGIWGFPLLAKRWRLLAILGSLASLAFLASSAQWGMWPMMVLDGVIVSLAVDADPPSLPQAKRGILKRLWFFIVQVVALVLFLYLGAAIATRPWQQHWNATDAEIARRLPGDERLKHRADLIDHVVTVNATPEQVWPWLVQLGQDKAGFYSYDWLERLIGMPIHNRYEIRPEWQHLSVGDYIGAYANRNAASWRVGAVEPNRLLYLEGWGPFWLEPTSDGKTRFGIRTDPGNRSFAFAPVEVFIFEPAHFLMEEKMLRTIKELSENQK